MRNNDQSPIIVSIVSLAYNHAKYIRQCLDGFIMQKTNFAFEVLIHDDASTDGTADIIREYELKYPNIIKPIYQTENQYQKGVAIGATYLYPRVQGKYIAECEGDDYWTDPLKLQRQVDFLETHSDYSMTTENATRLYLHTHKSEPFSKRPTGDIQIEELILTRQFATASVLYRMESMHLPQNIKIYDTLLWCLLAQNGKIHYQDVVSSVYRIGEGVTKKDKIKWAYHIVELNQSLFSVIKVSNKIKNIHDKELLAMVLSGIKTALEDKKYSDVYKLFIHALHIGVVPWMLLMKQIFHHMVFKLK